MNPSYCDLNAENHTKFLPKFLVKGVCASQRDLKSISDNGPSSKFRWQGKASLSVVAVDEVDCATEAEEENIVRDWKRHLRQKEKPV